jgi:single-strand DNA-binding protein
LFYKPPYPEKEDTKTASKKGKTPVLNKIMLIGNLGKDPDLQVTSDGTPFTRFSMAVNRTFKTQAGEKKEETEWFNIVAWRQLAEVCERYLHKGSKVYVEGRLTQRKYTDKQSIERTSVEVVATDVQFLDTKQAVSRDDTTLTIDDAFLPEE